MSTRTVTFYARKMESLAGTVWEIKGSRTAKRVKGTIPDGAEWEDYLNGGGLWPDGSETKPAEEWNKYYRNKED